MEQHATFPQERPCRRRSLASVCRFIWPAWRRQVEEGSYASNSEVIRDALRSWQESERGRAQRLDAIRAKIGEARRDPVRHTAEEVRQHFDRLLLEADKKHEL